MMDMQLLLEYLVYSLQQKLSTQWICYMSIWQLKRHLGSRRKSTMKHFCSSSIFDTIWATFFTSSPSEKCTASEVSQNLAVFSEFSPVFNQLDSLLLTSKLSVDYQSWPTLDQLLTKLQSNQSRQQQQRVSLLT